MDREVQGSSGRNREIQRGIGDGVELPDLGCIKRTRVVKAQRNGCETREMPKSVGASGTVLSGAVAPLEDVTPKGAPPNGAPPNGRPVPVPSSFFLTKTVIRTTTTLSRLFLYFVNK